MSCLRSYLHSALGGLLLLGLVALSAASCDNSGTAGLTIAPGDAALPTPDVTEAPALVPVEIQPSEIQQSLVATSTTVLPVSSQTSVVSPPPASLAVAPSTPSTTQPPVQQPNKGTPSPSTTVAPTPTTTTTSTTVAPPPPPAAPPQEDIKEPPTPSWQPQKILVAKPNLRETIPVYDAPGGNEIGFKDGPLWSYTYRENQLVLRVVQGNPGDEWVLAELPMRPWDNRNQPSGVRGWLRTAKFDWRTVNHHIQIDLSSTNSYPSNGNGYARVDFWNGDEWIVGTYAIIGKLSTHTPVMDSFIVEKIPGYSPVVGTRILMLSGFSTVYETFSGGLPRIALHGTHIPGRVGEELSNGCIRIPNNVIELINAQAPLGTRVNIIS